MQQAEQAEPRFPVLPEKNWWALRAQFRKAVPRQKLDANYVSSLLGVSQKSASAAIIPRLKTLGLLDSDGVPTDLAVRWRDDSQYAEVCDEIRSKIYPQSLLDLYPEKGADRNSVANWFARQARVGQNAAQQMASVYLLLLDADPSRESSSTKPKASSNPVRGSAVTRTKSSDDRKGQAENSDAPNDQRQAPAPPASTIPTLHIDLQIHISPESTPEQIDSIFASMAKHLYQR